MDLTEQKMKLVGIYNALQEQIDAYGLDEIDIDSEPFKKICARKQQIEEELKDINRLLSDNK